MEKSKDGRSLEELRKAYGDEPKKDDLRKYESADPIMQFFGFDHLPFPLRDVSRPFCDLAKHIVETLPWNHERTAALRKLLEAKDAAVRAALFKPGV